MVMPMKGKTAAAINASRQSRANMTTSKPTTLATSRTTLTSSVDVSRAIRLTSLMIRATSSPEWIEVKKLSDMPWIWA